MTNTNILNRLSIYYEVAISIVNLYTNNYNLLKTIWQIIIDMLKKYLTVYVYLDSLITRKRIFIISSFWANPMKILGFT